MALAVGVSLLMQRSTGPATIVSIPLGLAAVLGAITWFRRKKLLGTKFNRNVVGMVVIALVVIAMARTTGFFREVEMREHLMRDLYILGAMLSAGALILRPWAAVAALTALVSAFIVFAFPAHAMVISLFPCRCSR